MGLGRSLRDGLGIASLVGAIVVGAARTVVADADPPVGSAFAMFATVDVRQARTVTVTGGSGVVVEVPDRLAAERRLARQPVAGPRRPLHAGAPRAPPMSTPGEWPRLRTRSG